MQILLKLRLKEKLQLLPVWEPTLQLGSQINKVKFKSSHSNLRPWFMPLLIRGRFVVAGVSMPVG